MLSKTLISAAALCLVASAAPTSNPNTTPYSMWADILHKRSDGLFARQNTYCSDHENQGATWYDKGTDPNQITACGEVYDPYGWTVAISIAIDNPQQFCGRTVLVVSREKEAAAYATITDVNATGDLGEYALDMTISLFNELSIKNNEEDEDGIVYVDWVVTQANGPCP